MQVLDKQFVPYLSKATIQQRVSALAQEINQDYADTNPLFIAILNGAFVFASHLYTQINIPSTISFVKLVSYKGLVSGGSIVTSIGLEEDIRSKDIIIVEDIVDTGKTLSTFIPTLYEGGASSVKICALLQKPEALQYDLDIQYLGFSIPDKFVVGYGLDYDGYGRNYEEIFQILE